MGRERRRRIEKYKMPESNIDSIDKYLNIVHEEGYPILFIIKANVDTSKWEKYIDEALFLDNGSVGDWVDWNLKSVDGLLGIFEARDIESMIWRMESKNIGLTRHQIASIPVIVEISNDEINSVIETNGLSDSGEFKISFIFMHQDGKIIRATNSTLLGDRFSEVIYDENSVSVGEVTSG